jgi:lysophospholipase L1-like esterase
MSRLLRRILFATMLGMVTAEVLLQLGYCAMWWLGARPAAATAPLARADVLCIGDSFTYGMGASDPGHSYPAQLEARLRRELGPHFRVENRGWPGRSSRECLEAIDGWLAEVKPRYVCIAVGINDSWRLPEELVLPPPTAGGSAAPAGSHGEPYVWTFRLWRLAQAFRTANPFRDQPAPEGAAATAATVVSPLVGNWQLEGRAEAMRLDADGSAEVATGLGHWSSDGDRLQVVPNGAAPIVGRWQIAGSVLTVQVEPFGELRFQRSERPAKRNVAGEGVAAAERNDHATAVEAFTKAIADLPADVDDLSGLRVALVRSLCALGRSAEAAAQVDELRQRFAARGDDGSAVAFAGGLVALGKEDEALQVVERSLPHEPQSPWVWLQYATLVSKRGDLGSARRAIDRAIGLAKAQHQPDCSFFYRTKALFFRQEPDLATFADCVVIGFLEDHRQESTRQLLAQWNGKAAEQDAALRTAAAAHGLVEAEHDLLLRLRREAAGEGAEAWLAVLKSHLRQVAVHCRASGAEPIFGTYPFRGPIRQVGQAVASELQCQFLAIDITFQRLAKDEPNRVLYVADGHCNDDGYGVIAEHYARTILACEQARRGEKR